MWWINTNFGSHASLAQDCLFRSKFGLLIQIHHLAAPSPLCVSRWKEDAGEHLGSPSPNISLQQGKKAILARKTLQRFQNTPLWLSTRVIKAVVYIFCNKDCLTSIKCLIKIYALKISLLLRVIGQDYLYIYLSATRKNIFYRRFCLELVLVFIWKKSLIKIHTSFHILERSYDFI